jgi:hypothetical protein
VVVGDTVVVRVAGIQYADGTVQRWLCVGDQRFPRRVCVHSDHVVECNNRGGRRVRVEFAALLLCPIVRRDAERAMRVGDLTSSR